MMSSIVRCTVQFPPGSVSVTISQLSLLGTKTLPLESCHAEYCCSLDTGLQTTHSGLTTHHLLAYNDLDYHTAINEQETLHGING